MLFRFMCHDIVLQFINRMKLIQYADDMKIMMKIKSQEDVAILQHEINNFDIWCHKNRFLINPEKTFHGTYGRMNLQSKYFLCDNLIKLKQGIRDLGLYFDKDLNFKEHVKQISSKCQGLLTRMSRFCKTHGINSLMYV